MAQTTKAPKKKRDQKSKHWCWTLNNPSEADDLEVEGMKEIATYIVYQPEEGQQGTRHYQGYVAFVNRHELTYVRKVLTRASWRIAKGSSLENFGYCSDWRKRVDGKDGEVHEWGERPVSGGQATKRSWDEAFENARLHRLDAIPGDIKVRYYGNVKRIMQDNPIKCRSLPDVCGFWLYGQAGCGKSTAAREFAGGEEYFFDKPCNKWWDGYQGEPVVILDDFDLGHSVLGHHLKRWADKYSFPAEQKGTTTQIRPRVIIVTSQYRPCQIFHGDDALIEAIERRFKIFKLIKDF